jgi:hypothetical protein
MNAASQLLAVGLNPPRAKGALTNSLINVSLNLVDILTRGNTMDHMHKWVIIDECPHTDEDRIYTIRTLKCKICGKTITDHDSSGYFHYPVED